MEGTGFSGRAGTAVIADPIGGVGVLLVLDANNSLTDSVDCSSSNGENVSRRNGHPIQYFPDGAGLYICGNKLEGLLSQLPFSFVNYFLRFRPFSASAKRRFIHETSRIPQKRKENDIFADDIPAP